MRVRVGWVETLSYSKVFDMEPEEWRAWDAGAAGDEIITNRIVHMTSEEVDACWNATEDRTITYAEPVVE